MEIDSSNDMDEAAMKSREFGMLLTVHDAILISTQESRRFSLSTL